MFAIVQCKGFQYRVAPEDRVRIPLTQAEPGSTLVLDQILMVRDGDAFKIGTPILQGAKIEAEVVRHGRGKKIIVGKFKKRKGYRRRRGHRQDFTEILIRSISS